LNWLKWIGEIYLWLPVLVLTRKHIRGGCHDNENVKGIIVAGKYNGIFYQAQKAVKNVEVALYEVNFRLNGYK
ncbi:MAG: hypothetical protein QF645_04875, partial [Planctomycetota bacterium]|nr:hypothetical protein [Planctomycetota bacterium]